MMTMHLDNPERFVIVKGKVDITPVTLQVCVYSVCGGACKSSQQKSTRPRQTPSVQQLWAP